MDALIVEFCVYPVCAAAVEDGDFLFPLLDRHAHYRAYRFADGGPARDAHRSGRVAHDDRLRGRAASGEAAAAAVGAEQSSLDHRDARVFLDIENL